MKNLKVIITVLILGILKLSIAQYNSPPPPPPPQEGNVPPTGYLVFNLGISQPMGGFAAENGLGYSGYALPGNNLGLSLGMPVMHSNFGVALMYNYSWNPQDINGYVGNIQYTDQSNTYYPISQDAYRESFIMGGLFATIPIQRLSIDFRLMGGVAICSLPEIDYGENSTSVTASQDFEWDTYSSTSSSFATDIGAGLRFRLRRTVLMAGMDYIYADPMVSTTQHYTDQYGNSTYTHVGGTIPISMVSYSLGIGYVLR